ncbi:MAG: ribbon-helix-helix protein, CopG family, partial [Candidatus Obscuribacterales bacterium]
MATQKRAFNPKIESRLASEDFKRLEAMAQAQGVSKSQIVRDAVLHYLDNRDAIAARPRESEVARAINEMTNRICGMLARQGATVGTLYELAWMSLPN